MQDDQPKPLAAQTWENLAQVYATSRQLSADLLIEWPAQLKLCDNFQDKRILDVGCGTGVKARYFAEHGAMQVKVAGLKASPRCRKWQTSPLT